MQLVNPNLPKISEDPLSQHLSKILAAVSESGDKNEEPLRLFAPMTGGLWNGGIMFVGRALYGWGTEKFAAEEAKNEDRRYWLVKDAWKKSRTQRGDALFSGSIIVGTTLGSPIRRRIILTAPPFDG
jgi:hypothetical protein